MKRPVARCPPPDEQYVGWVDLGDASAARSRAKWARRRREELLAGAEDEAERERIVRVEAGGRLRRDADEVYVGWVAVS